MNESAATPGLIAAPCGTNYHAIVDSIDHYAKQRRFILKTPLVYQIASYDQQLHRFNRIRRCKPVGI